MPFYLRKQPLEIPSPTEKDWIKKDEEEDFLLKDPDEILDSLPQPFLMIHKMVILLFERAWEIIEGKCPLEETKQQNFPHVLCQPSAEFQVVGRVNCLAASGGYVFTGLSTGLSVFSLPQREKLCAWEVAKLEICTIQVAELGSGPKLLGAVDELGFAHLFYFFRENLLHIKNINEVDDMSKRSTCTALELSHAGDYAGFLLQGSSEVWLEIYRLPKDSWMKETEHVQTVTTPVLPSAPGFIKETKISQPSLLEKSVVKETKISQPSLLEKSVVKETKISQPSLLQKSTDVPACGLEDMDLQQMLSRLESRLIPPVLLLKVRSPKQLTASQFKNPFEALMKSDDGSGIGLGNNHMIRECQFEQQEAIFNSAFQQFLEIENDLDGKEAKHSHTMFHFHLPGHTLPAGPENKAEPDVPVAFSVHWSTSHNLCFYLLSRPPKEKPDSDPKPDVVWPCAAVITCSAVTPCSSYLAFACEDGAITVWDKYLGFPLCVTVLPEGYVIRSIQFMPCSPPPGRKTACSSKASACTKVQLLVLCTDGSLHLITAGAKECNTKLLGHRPQAPSQTISAVAALSTFPDAVLIFFWDGIMNLMDTATQENVCQFILPPSYKVASPWQPVFSVDTDDQYLILRGDEQFGGVKAETETIFLFDFKSYSFMETFAMKAESSSSALAELPWDKRCDAFLNDNLQRLSVISQQMPECWSQLREYAGVLTRGKPEEAMRQRAPSTLPKSTEDTHCTGWE